MYMICVCIYVCIYMQTHMYIICDYCIHLVCVFIPFHLSVYRSYTCVQSKESQDRLPFFVPPSLYLSLSLFTHTHTLTHLYIYIYKHMCVYIHTRIYIHTHIYIYTYTHTHIYIYPSIYHSSHLSVRLSLQDGSISRFSLMFADITKAGS